jgi:hypothetical protein
MKSRSRIFVLQALMVAALVGVVYATLLRPDGPEELTGLQEPPPIGAGVPDPDTHADAGDRRPGDRRGEDRPPGGPRRGAATGSDTGAPGPTSAGDGVATDGPPASSIEPGLPADTDAGDPGSPTDDQYDDTLARLNALLD